MQWGKGEPVSRNEEATKGSCGEAQDSQFKEETSSLEIASTDLLAMQCI